MRGSLVRHVFLRAGFGAIAFAAAWSPVDARASTDTFGLGDGHWGAFVASSPGSTMFPASGFTAVSGNANAGDTQIIVVQTGGFVVGDLVLVWETTGIATATSGDQTSVNLAANPVGRWELARVASIQNGTTMTFTGPLLNSYAATDTQIVRVPEFTTVTIDANASIVPSQAWLGDAGGILAFLATGAVTNAGVIDADASGFRGGAAIVGLPTGLCQLLDQSSPEGAEKGEGLLPLDYGPQSAGRGNLADGPGGGVCNQAGGGGGANGGQGGQGGNSSDGNRPVGGLGGAKLQYSLYDHATFGSGGGAGQEFNGMGTGGGAGGGFVFIRGLSLSGAAGIIRARGASLGTAGDDGQGGGGAGGSAYVRFKGNADCASIDVSGGTGGSSSSPDVGPGGGGAGGHVLFQAAGGTCTVNLLCGLAGVQTDADGGGEGLHYGGTPTSQNDPSCMGVEETPVGGFCSTNSDCMLPTPICDVPLGICVQCLTNNDCMNGQTCDQATHTCVGGDAGAGDGGGGDGGSSGGDAATDGSSGGDGSAGDGSSGDGSSSGGDGSLGDGSGSDGSSGGGDGASSGGDGSGNGDGGNDGSVVEGGGCSCSLVGETTSGAAGVLATIMGVIGLGLRRAPRRRR
jgi:hypothetical protein